MKPNREVMTPRSLIQFSGVTLGYGSKIIASNLTWEICHGDFLGIVGPNGAGKTTILRAILGILKPLRGTIAVFNKNGSKPYIGYVPQRETINPVLPYTVHDIVLMGRYGRLGIFRRPKPIDSTMVFESLEHVGIRDLAEIPFKELSGGQKQRTLIARALVTEPDILILDEPTNGMDLSSRIGILDLIRHFHEEHNITVIMVSHLLNDVANYVRRIALVEENYFQVDSVDTILTDSNLSQLYGLDIKVGECFGIKFIAAGGKSV